MLEVGTIAPGFSITDHHGQTRTLEEFQGKTLVLWFYPKADTPGCTAEGCSFRDNHAVFNEHQVVIVGVSLDTVAENKAFAEKFSFPFPLLCDTERSLSLAYGAVESQGSSHAQRIAVVIGPDSRVREYEPKVDAKTYPAELCARLSAA